VTVKEVFGGEKEVWVVVGLEEVVKVAGVRFKFAPGTTAASGPNKVAQ